MKRLLLTPLILGFFSPVNAGIYFYPDYQDGIEVRCKDGKPKHLVEITKAGRGMRLEGHGDDQYSWPIIYMFPEILIDQVFSLRKNNIRGSLSLGVIINNDGTISFTEIVQSLIKVNYKLSYEDADELIDYAPREEEDLSIISRLLEKRNCYRKKKKSYRTYLKSKF